MPWTARDRRIACTRPVRIGHARSSNSNDQPDVISKEGRTKYSGSQFRRLTNSGKWRAAISFKKSDPKDLLLLLHASHQRACQCRSAHQRLEIAPSHTRPPMGTEDTHCSDSIEQAGPPTAEVRDGSFA